MHLSVLVKISLKKIAPYFTRAGALFFMSVISDKSYYSYEHNYKGE